MCASSFYLAAYAAVSPLCSVVPIPSTGQAIKAVR